MPTYQYACQTCEATASVTQPINEPIKAPQCLACKQPMHRQYETPAITFKGTGWGADKNRGKTR